MLIIPAIDLRGGHCVRLTHGDYSQETIYSEDPADLGAKFEQDGAKLLHVVDLDGARAGLPQNLKAVEAICRRVSIRVEFGGGIRTLQTAKKALAVGVSRVVLGTRLASDWGQARVLLSTLGPKAVAAIDARDGKVATEGWTEDSGIDAMELAKRLETAGAARFIVTDIGTDGALQGPNIEFLTSILESVSRPVIASGGISSLQDIEALANLTHKNLEGIIVGKAIYEGRFTVKQAVALSN